MFAAGASGMWIALPLIGAVMVYGIVLGIIRKRNGKE
jgi:flagellar biosynthesis protein FliR